VTPSIRIQDIADILIMTFLLYQMYSWFRGTRAMQVLFGLGVVTLIYFATRFLGLYMTSWVLQELGTVLIILIVVVFQVEIRQALYRFSLLRHFFDSRSDTTQNQFQEIAETLFGMASRRTGALVVLQHNESLSEVVTNGESLDCEISPHMLESIFYDGAPFHDGAVLIRDGRIAQAACHLPLSVNQNLPRHLGTRHRAALGLSERSDAVIVAVSEERGEVSVAVNGKLLMMPSPTELIAFLDDVLSNEKEPLRIPRRQILFANMLPKVAILLAVSVCWALITTRQGQITNVSIPVRLHGIPEEMVLLRTSPEELNVQLKSLSILTPAPARLDLTAEIDASALKEGQSTIRVQNSDISLPSGMVIAAISPPAVKITAERKTRKTVPVTLSLKGKLPAPLSAWRVDWEPKMADIEGPASQVAPIGALYTDDIDATRLNRGAEYRQGIRQPPGQVVLVRETAVVVKLMPRKAGQR